MDYSVADYATYNEAEVLPLYESVGWTNYTERPEMLKSAYHNSLLALGAYGGEKLVGVIRAVGDGHSVVFVQDLLVHPDHQHRGVGTALMRELMARFPSVYQFELMTDDTPKTDAFYRSLGLDDAAELGCKAFTKLQGF